MICPLTIVAVAERSEVFGFSLLRQICEAKARWRQNAVREGLLYRRRNEMNSLSKLLNDLLKSLVALASDDHISQEDDTRLTIYFGFDDTANDRIPEIIRYRKAFSEEEGRSFRVIRNETLGQRVFKRDADGLWSGKKVLRLHRASTDHLHYDGHGADGGEVQGWYNYTDVETS